MPAALPPALSQERAYPRRTMKEDRTPGPVLLHTPTACLPQGLRKGGKAEGREGGREEAREGSTALCAKHPRLMPLLAQGNFFWLRRSQHCQQLPGHHESLEVPNALSQPYPHLWMQAEGTQLSPLSAGEGEFSHCPSWRQEQRGVFPPGSPVMVST